MRTYFFGSFSAYELSAAPITQQLRKWVGGCHNLTNPFLTKRKLQCQTDFHQPRAGVKSQNQNNNRSQLTLDQVIVDLKPPIFQKQRSEARRQRIVDGYLSSVEALHHWT